jgi:transposase InsO family protein
LICRVLGVNRSGTYRSSSLEIKDKLLVQQIQQIRLNNPFYGVNRLQLAFKEDEFGSNNYFNSNNQSNNQNSGEKLTINDTPDETQTSEDKLFKNISLNRLRRVCNLYNLQPKPYYPKVNCPVKIQDRNKSKTTIANHLKPLQQIIKFNKQNRGIPLFESEVDELVIHRPNQVWCSDFTYLKFQNIWYYLATILDVYTKEITGFSIPTRHDTELVKTALKMALNRVIDTTNHNTTNTTTIPTTSTTPKVKTMLHSDQGSEYTAQEYLDLLEANQLEVSNSAKASPWENGFQESFYGKFKPELELEKLPTNSTFADIYNYISNQLDYYNNHRIHTSIKTTPIKFKQQYYLKQSQSHYQKRQVSEIQDQTQYQDQLSKNLTENLTEKVNILDTKKS